MIRPKATKFVFAFGTGISLFAQGACSAGSPDEGATSIESGLGATGASGASGPYCPTQLRRACKVSCTLESAVSVPMRGREYTNEDDTRAVDGCAGGGTAVATPTASIAACTYTDAKGMTGGYRYASWSWCTEKAEVFAVCKFEGDCTDVSVLVGGSDRAEVKTSTEANASSMYASGSASGTTEATLSIWGGDVQTVSAKSEAATHDGGCALEKPTLSCNVQLNVGVPTPEFFPLGCSMNLFTCHFGDNHAASSAAVRANTQTRYVEVSSPGRSGTSRVQVSNIGVHSDHLAGAGAGPAAFQTDGARGDAKAFDTLAKVEAIMTGVRVGKAPACTTVTPSGSGKVALNCQD